MSSETGVFWLAGDPDTRLPGHLVFSDAGGPRLELHGQLTPSRKVVSHDEATGTTRMEPADEPKDLLVHGFLENSPRRVTLIECATSGRQEVHALGVPLDQHELRSSAMVRGAHINGDDTFTGVRLRVAGIDSWAGLTPFHRGDQEGGVVLGVPWHDLPTVESSKGEKLSVDEQISTSWGSLIEGRISRLVWLEVESQEELTLRQIDRRYVTPIASYLSLVIGGYSPLVGMQVKFEDTWLEVRHPGVRPDRGPRVQLGDVLLPLRAAGLEVLAGFLDVYERTGPVAPVIADLLPHGSNPNIETQVLELTTVAEGVHRQLFPDDLRMTEPHADRIRGLVRAAVSEEDERCQNIISGLLSHLEEAGYRRRLKRLADEVADAMPGTCGKSKRWIEVVDRARNSFAHRKQGLLDDSSIDEYIAVSQSLRWVLMGVLLLQAGLSPESLAAALKQNQQYRHFREQMDSLLPRVYESTESKA